MKMHFFDSGKRVRNTQARDPVLLDDLPGRVQDSDVALAVAQINADGQGRGK